MIGKRPKVTLDFGYFECAYLKKRYSSKKYNEYPVIIDNENDIELTLDSVVVLLNDYECDHKRDVREYNDLRNQINYYKRKIEEEKSKNRPLIWFIISLILIIIWELSIIYCGGV